MRILFTILLICLVNTQNERQKIANKYEEQLALDTSETPEALLEKEAQELNTIDLTTETITGYWNEIIAGDRPERFRIEGKEGMGSSYIEFSKLSNKRLRVSVHFLDPNSTSENYQETYKGVFKWINKFKTMVGINCWQEPPKVIEIPKVEHECKYGIDIAANVVKVALSANIKDIEEGGYDSLAECVKEKTIKYETTPFHDCLLKTMENTELARATLAAKVVQLRQAGWECDEDNYCRMKQGEAVVSEVVETSSVVVGGMDDENLNTP